MADIITLPAARAHLRLEDDYPPEQLQPYIDGAWAAAEDFLNRRIYATGDERTAAVAAVRAAQALAVAAHVVAVAAADLMVDWDSRCSAREDADAELRAARAAATEIRRSIVADDRVRAAIQLMLGHLFEHREDVVMGSASELPAGSRHLLQPLRIGLGV